MLVYCTNSGHLFQVDVKMDKNALPRGRARGRARISTQNLVDMDITPPLGPPPMEEGNSQDNGGDGDSPGGSGGKRRRSSSDVEMEEAGQQQRSLGEEFLDF